MCTQYSKIDAHTPTQPLKTFWVYRAPNNYRYPHVHSVYSMYCTLVGLRVATALDNVFLIVGCGGER